MSTVGEGPKLVIDFENYRPGQDSVSMGEGEQNVAKRLLTDVVSVHKKLIDIVVMILLLVILFGSIIAWNMGLMQLLEQRITIITPLGK